MPSHNVKPRLQYLVIASVIFGPAGLIPFFKYPGLFLSAIMASLVALLCLVFNNAPYVINIIIITSVFWTYASSIIIAVYHDDILGGAD